MARPASKPSPADIITQSIIDRLEAGVRPWVKPWRPGIGGRPLRVTGDPYRGINCFWLWLVAESAGYASRTWMTYKQAQALGAQVREGERAQFAIFYKSYTKAVESPATGGTTDEQRHVLRSYSVFNGDQIDGLPEQFRPTPLGVVPPADRLPERARAFVDALPAKVHLRGDCAFYDRIADAITMPAVEQFKTRAFWASTLAHEAGHYAARRFMPRGCWQRRNFGLSPRGMRHNLEASRALARPANGGYGCAHGNQTADEEALRGTGGPGLAGAT